MALRAVGHQRNIDESVVGHERKRDLVLEGAKVQTAQRVETRFFVVLYPKAGPKLSERTGQAVEVVTIPRGGNVDVAGHTPPTMGLRGRASDQDVLDAVPLQRFQDRLAPGHVRFAFHAATRLRCASRSCTSSRVARRAGTITLSSGHGEASVIRTRSTSEMTGSSTPFAIANDEA